MPCCGCSPCGQQPPRGPFVEVLGPGIQNDILELCQKMIGFLSCADNREMKIVSTKLQAQLQECLIKSLTEQFPEADRDCLAEVVPNLVRVGFDCIQECDPNNPSKFILCIARNGTDHFVALVRCLFGAEQTAQIQSAVMKTTMEDGMFFIQSFQAGLLEILLQILLPLLCGMGGGGAGSPCNCPPAGGGGGGGTGGGFFPSEEPRC